MRDYREAKSPDRATSEGICFQQLLDGLTNDTISDEVKRQSGRKLKSVRSGEELEELIVIVAGTKNVFTCTFDDAAVLERHRGGVGH